MSDNINYYYLKLKDNFFDSDELKILERMPNGYKYSNILLKLYLKSLKFGGALRLNEYIPYNLDMIAALTGHDIDTVRVAIKIFEDLKLIETLDNGTIYMLNIQSLIGKSSTEGDRKKLYRMKIEEEKRLLTSGTNGGQMSDECPTSTDKNPPEIDIEKDTELDTRDIDEKRDTTIPFAEIIEYLNFKAHTQFKVSSRKTHDLIKARFNEKFTLEDFKKVIDIKCAEWMNSEFERYLRPETLFGPKFEGYLNQKGSNKVSKSEKEKTFSNYDQRQYNFDELEKNLLGWTEDRNNFDS